MTFQPDDRQKRPAQGLNRQNRPVGPRSQGPVRRKKPTGPTANTRAKRPRTGFSGKEKLAALVLFVLLLALLLLVGQYRKSRTLRPGSQPDAARLGANGEASQDSSTGGEEPANQRPGQDQDLGSTAQADQAGLKARPVDDQAFTIAAVGDVLIHDALLNAGAKEDGSYDFRPLFTRIGPIIQQADLAAFDMEGVFRGAPYSGYPSFSVPEDLAANLKEVGFDLAITANNHAMDFDVDAMMRTARVCKEAGLIPIGTRENYEDPTFFIQEIKGIKVGISAFTYESPRQGADLSLRSFNNVPISIKNSKLIDSFYVSHDWPDFWEEDAGRIEDRVKEMREAGAEVVIFFMHWGTEYAQGRDQAQGYYAQVLANSGVDLVLACGPHVVQEIRAVPAEQGDHTMLCFYSIGNCVSNQQFDTGNSEGRAQDGLIALASFKRGSDGQVALDRAGYVAHTVYKEYPEKGDRPYTKALALPIEQGLQQAQAWQLTDQALADLKAAQARIQEIMDKNEARGLPLEAYAGFFE